MKPKHLSSPFSWSERKPFLGDRIFFVPRHYEGHEAWGIPDWESASFFGNKNPIFVEYCSGNGKWIAEKAAADKEKNWIAVERQFVRARKIWSKAHNLKLTNLFVICGEAFDFTKHYLKEESIEGIYINFPDPWPKERHAKHRIFQSFFIEEMARVLQKEGKGMFVTDDAPYSEQIKEEMIRAGWKPLFPDPFHVTSWDSYGKSYFSDLWESLGREILYMQFSKGV